MAHAQPRLELIGVVALEVDEAVNADHVGGLSGLAWSDATRTWLAVSDHARATRIFEIGLDADARTARVMREFECRLDARDAESIAPAPDGGWFIGCESPPTIFRLDADFHARESLRGVDAAGATLQPNKSWEALAVLPSDPPLLLAISEVGPAPTADEPRAFARSKAIALDAATGAVRAQGNYALSPAPGFGATGLSEIEAVDEGRFLTLQRSVTAPRGYDGLVELVEMREEAGELYFQKTRLGSLHELGVRPIGNVECMALGPVLEDGSRLLVLVNDDNFGRDIQRGTQLIVLRLLAE